MNSDSNIALDVNVKHQTDVEKQTEYIERFDILETINNVGNDEVFTPVKTCKMILDMLPDEVWHNPNYKWLNPCDKNGVFLREIALRLDEGLKYVIPDEETRKKHILQDMLYSIGLTRFTSLVSRRTVYYCAYANRQPDGDIDADGHCRNGYAIGLGKWFDTEEGNILTPITDHDFKNGKCKYCGTSQNGRYDNENQKEHYAYEFIHVNHLNLERHLQDRFFKGDRNMKFDIIIGNPPYQLSDGGNGASAGAIYNLFIDMAKYLEPTYFSFIVPSRWMACGKVPADFRHRMLTDTRIQTLHDHINYTDCFPNSDIDLKGGVCYFLWNKNYNGKCDIYTYYTSDKIEHTIRYLAEEGYYQSEKDKNGYEGMNVFIRYKPLLDIYKLKLCSECGDGMHKLREESFSTIVSSRKPYGLSTSVFSEDEKRDVHKFHAEPFSNSLKVFGNKKVMYVSKDDPEIVDKTKSIKAYKVFLPKVNGAGIFGEKLSSSIFVAGPDEICTETFLSIGCFDTKKEAENCLSYIKTKFFRALLGTKKITLDNPSEVFDLIPLQDFSEPWTDERLFAKYDLTDEMKDFIEDNVQEMA